MNEKSRGLSKDAARWRRLGVKVMRRISHVLCGIGGALLALLIQGALAKESPAKTPRLHPTFAATLGQLTRDYVEPLNTPDYWNALTRCAMEELDPYSYWLAPEQQREHVKGNPFGVSVSRRPGHDASGPVRIVHLEPGAAAQKAGLALGTRIDAINGQPVEALSKQADLDLALSPGADGQLRLKTSSGTYRLGARSNPQTSQQSLTHRSFKCADKRCLFFSLRGFSAGVAQRLRSVVESTPSHQLGGIVLDLQGNPGGDIDQAVAIADLFLDEGVIARVRGRAGKLLREIRASASQTLPKSIPVAVLVDAYTASASELLSAALQDHRRALIVGDPSFGKGSIQRIHRFADGSLLRYTTGRYYSPLDHVIDQRGISPDLHWHASGQSQTLSDASLCQLFERKREGLPVSDHRGR